MNEPDPAPSIKYGNTFRNNARELPIAIEIDEPESIEQQPRQHREREEWCDCAENCSENAVESAMRRRQQIFSVEDDCGMFFDDGVQHRQYLQSIDLIERLSRQ